MAPTRLLTGPANFWVDVGALLRGRGAITGIPRMISQLVTVWLTDAELRLRLCRFDTSAQAYEEVPAEILHPAPPRPPVAASGCPGRLRGVVLPGLKRVCRPGWRAFRNLVPGLRRPVPRTPALSPFRAMILLAAATFFRPV